MELPRKTWTLSKVKSFFNLPKETPFRSYVNNPMDIDNTESITGSNYAYFKDDWCDDVCLVYRINSFYDYNASTYEVYIRTGNCFINYNFDYISGICFDGGRVLIEYTNKLGKMSNFSGPAISCYNDINKSLNYEIYMLNGKYHNITGPAYRYFDILSQAWRNHYYINGEGISVDSYCKLIERRWRQNEK